MNERWGSSIPAPDALESVRQYEAAADQLLAVSDKAAVERAARVLALYVGHYQRRYGPIATAAALETSAGTLSTAEQIADRAEAMRVLAAALTIARLAAAVTDETDDEPRAGG